MLVRSTKSFGEVYAYWEGDSVLMYDDEDVSRYGFETFEPVTKSIIRWLDKPVKVTCDVANDPESKKIGLSQTDFLDENEGMYFPYAPRSDVRFHQGGVKYPLDIIFIRDSKIVKIIRNTEIDSKELWECENCDGVLEVNGGFCRENRVSLGDVIVPFFSSNNDVRRFTEDMEMRDRIELSASHLSDINWLEHSLCFDID
jgi:uncharacterized membrane protein (UPF0127 family)